MRWKPVLVSALLLTTIPMLVQAEVKLREQPEVADALKVLDMWIEQHVTHRGVPGLSIAIVLDQEIDVLAPAVVDDKPEGGHVSTHPVMMHGHAYFLQKDSLAGGFDGSVELGQRFELHRGA